MPSSSQLKFVICLSGYADISLQRKYKPHEKGVLFIAA